MSAPRWGDDLDDSDDETAVMPTSSAAISSTARGGKGAVVPPTHKSRIDAKGIQIVTSYRPHPANPNQLWKTVTKVRVSQERRREPKGVAARRRWKKFGEGLADERREGNQKSTIQSKDDIFLEDPNADTDLQDEDATKAIAGNLNAFWAKQARRQLERKYEVSGVSAAEAGGAPPLAAAAAAAAAQDGGGWTQVAAGGAAAAGGKYVPPAARAGAAGPGAGGSTAFKPERRDDLNTIRVTNISENTTEADLQDLFQRFGRISRVYLAKDKETLISRGFAFVSFVNKDDAARAMEALQGFGYDHLILKLEWARPNTPKDPASSGTEFRSGYGKALAQDTTSKVSFASNLTK
jgi:translation initiation factor 3 subunit G